jgi:hypothetical protein
VGSLTSRRRSCACNLAAIDAAPTSFGIDAAIARNANVLQEKSSKHAAAIVGTTRM